MTLLRLRMLLVFMLLSLVKTRLKGLMCHIFCQNSPFFLALQLQNRFDLMLMMMRRWLLQGAEKNKNPVSHL